MLFRGSVDDDAVFESVAYASSLWLLACCVDGVDDAVYKFGVADDGLVVHQPDVDDSAVWVDSVVGVLCVAL